ncbi:aminotransferase class V-fold PLP-dependent enzyme [Deinococcus psychrotolerans]|uniref:Aminotransferase class V-fold PLP-dependent enzyme n=1 Tax=Deinococcus psychrotolerans TaxID=2489213 RepID=A0A3G8Y9Z3_9DEIO|nr:aminotransferase class V-fold PLP-dependent enzyme [Deinococcus psychrotolerans]AZI42189.1 aminotransferase class V-fold PLP-dependent enzyme [Deinococcus psychrotolerans]
MDNFTLFRTDLIGQDTVIRTPFGDRRVTYADHVASGRALRSSEAFIVERVLPLYANTHTDDSATGAMTTHLAHQACEYVKTQLGADKNCTLVWCGSGSTGAVKRLQEILGLAVPPTLLAKLRASFPPDERPVVFVGPYEHHSNEVTWRETLADVVEVPLCPRGGIDLDALRTLLKAPEYRSRQKIGSFSAASNVTGYLSDTRALARLLHAHGALAFFDFAACAPYLKIDMRSGRPDGYDAVFLSPHKFAGGPGTPGLLCFQNQIYPAGAPTTAGGGTVSYVSRTAHHFVEDIEAREDAGTPAILGKIRTALAFKAKERLGIDAIAEREHALISRAIARLRTHPRLQLLGNLDEPRLAVLSFLVRTEDSSMLHPRLVVRLLNDLFGIQSRGGCACAGPYGHALLNIDDQTSQRYMHCALGGLGGLKPGWTRLNFAPWTSEAEFLFLLSALEFVADFGERFVPLYDMDFHTGTWTHPADQPLPDLFDFPVPARQEGEVPYAAYLAQARELASTLRSPEARPIPPEVPGELVFFSY